MNPVFLQYLTLSVHLDLVIYPTSFGLDFFSDDELLLTETDFTEQNETIEQTEQTEIGPLNDVDIDNFIKENRNKNTTQISDLNVF